MIGDVSLCFTKDKFTNITVKPEGRGMVQIEIENGDVELTVGLSKKQTAELRAALDKA